MNGLEGLSHPRYTTALTVKMYLYLVIVMVGGLVGKRLVRFA